MTSQRLGCATLVAAAILTPAAAQAIEMSAGDWKFEVTGNVNAHYIYSECDDAPVAVAGGLACLSFAGEDKSSSISNGLLPASIGFTATTTQRGYDLGVTFGFYPGISTNDGGRPNLGPGMLPNTNTALGTAAIDMRQVFLTFGNDRMGEFMFGRNIGLFGGDVILNDMTIHGVGAGNGNYAAPANTSLGSIGLGYIYPDWLAQMNYTTPDWNGFKATLGVFDPLEPVFQGAPTPKGVPGFHGKLAYAFGENLYLSATYLYQEQEGITDAQDFSSNAFDVGGKYSIAGFEILGWYYNGRGVGTTGLFILSDDGNGNRRKSDGFLAQITYKIVDTKLGVNYGQSKLDRADNEIAPLLVRENRKWTAGVYHSLTENLTLLVEYTEIHSEAQQGFDNESKNFNIGAFLSF
jgi:predicted porin